MLCVVVSSFMWVLYLVRGTGGPVGVARATSPSYDVTCSLSERGSSQLVSEPSSTLGDDGMTTTKSWRHTDKGQHIDRQR